MSLNAWLRKLSSCFSQPGFSVVELFPVCLDAKSSEEHVVYKVLKNSAATLIQRTTTEAPRRHMYYIGLDVHKKTISYCVKDASGQVYQQGNVGATRWELDAWVKTLPQPRAMAIEATIFTGWDLRSPEAARGGGEGSPSSGSHK
jgi:hypothetical protein